MYRESPYLRLMARYFRRKKSELISIMSAVRRGLTLYHVLAMRNGPRHLLFWEVRVFGKCGFQPASKDSIIHRVLPSQKQERFVQLADLGIHPLYRFISGDFFLCSVPMRPNALLRVLSLVKWLWMLGALTTRACQISSHHKHHRNDQLRQYFYQLTTQSATRVVVPVPRPASRTRHLTETSVRVGTRAHLGIDCVQCCAAVLSTKMPWARLQTIREKRRHLKLPMLGLPSREQGGQPWVRSNDRCSKRVSTPLLACSLN